MRNVPKQQSAYVPSTSLGGVVEFVFGVLVLGGAAGFVFGRAGIRTGGLAVVTLGLLGLVAYLAHDRRAWRQLAVRNHQLVARYCSVIVRRLSPAWRTKLWKEALVIRHNGDATIVLTIKAVVDCESLDFFKFYLGPKWVQPERYRSRVRAHVRGVAINGVRGTQPLAALSWLPNGKLEIAIHFNEPVGRGAEIDIVAEVRWPAKCLPLMKWDVAEEFCAKFLRPIDRFEYRITLPAGRKAYHDVVGLVRDRDDYRCSVKVSDSGKTEVRLVAKNVAAGRNVGLRLGLKEKRRPPVMDGRLSAH